MTEGRPLTPEADEVLRELDELVPALQRNDPAATTRLYELTVDLVASIVFGVVRDRHDTDELVQEVYIRWVNAAPRFEGDGRGVRAWLARTARNTAIDLLRSARHRREVVHDQLPDATAPTEDPLDAFPDPALVEALEELTDDQRDALLLRTVHGLSGDEVAQVLGRSRPAVYQLVWRAERALRTALERP